MTPDADPAAAPAVPDAARREHAELAEQLRHHDRLYYEQDAPEISDEAYDALFRRLTELELSHPALVTPDSPSQSVGGAPVPHLVSVAHRRPMLSLANTYSRDEVADWLQSVHDYFAGSVADIVFSIEPKLDGVALELVYERGTLTRAITRGDGKVGDDVTHTAHTIRDLPHQLPADEVPALLEVRGEVLMTHADFAAVNRARAAADLELFVNPRNLTSGTIKMLDPREAARRPLSFVAYGLGVADGLATHGHAETTRRLADWGLPVAGELATTGDLEHVLAHHDRLLADRGGLPFDVDGTVIKVDRYTLQDRLGERSRSPRWAIAFKFPASQGQSVVVDIVVQVGRTGALTPKAVIEPVYVGGVTIEHVTLHNGDEIERLGVKVGDTVKLERAGDVIPKIVSVVKDGGGPAYRMPSACPVCETPVEDDPDEVVLRCPNVRCPAVLRRRIEHFVSRSAMDVEGVGAKLIDQLVEQGLVTDLADLFALEAPALAALPRMGETSAANVIAGLEAARTRSFSRLLFGLGVRHVGQHVAEVVASRWTSPEALRGASAADLEDVAEIGPKVAASLEAWLADADEQAMLDRMLERGLAPTAPAPPASGSGPLAGRSFLFTGSLAELSRKEAGELVKTRGGKLLSGVSKNLDVLVVGEKPGSKLKKAEELGIEVLTEAQFLELVRGESA